MTTETKVCGACPRHFRATCREAARQATDVTYESAGFSLAGWAAGLLSQVLDDDDAVRRLTVLSDLIHRPGPPLGGGYMMVRSLGGFLRSDDAGAVIAWFRRELPRCMALVPRARYGIFLRGVYRYAVEEENDVTAI